MIHYAITILSILLTTTVCTAATGRSVTFFSDGAVVEMELTASKGSVEFSLPTGMIENSLRITPLNSSQIRSVEITPLRLDQKRVKELDALHEQKNRLEDRLKALETREEIFRAAAKSQSGKAPRKTKNNPDPMQSIRQGTEFAIAQLESVYTARRKTEKELRRVDAKIAAIGKSGSVAEKQVRVSVSPARGRLKTSYAIAGTGWNPVYDFRLNGDGHADVSQYGFIPAGFAQYLLKASPASLAESHAAPVIRTVSGRTAKLAEYRLPTKYERFTNSVTADFSCELVNSTNVHLPPGEATVFYKGEYRGKVRFEGMSSARSRKVTSGR